MSGYAMHNLRHCAVGHCRRGEPIRTRSIPVFQSVHYNLTKLHTRQSRSSGTPLQQLCAPLRHSRLYASRSESSETAEAAPSAFLQDEEKHRDQAKGKAEGKAGDKTQQADLPLASPVFKAPGGARQILTSFKLLFAPFWRKFKKGSVLVIELNGDIPEQKGGRFSPSLNVPQLKEALLKAAYDPRIRGIHLKVGSVNAGWARLQELRRSLDFFRSSGKFSIATMERGGEKEYFMCCGCQEIYIPPTANLTLKGFAVAGTFLRGVLEKVGVEPQVKRIGKYKSAGDQLLRRDMSEAQREQLTALLEDIYEGFTQQIAKDRSKTVEQVEEMLNAGIFDMQKYADDGWVTGLKYEDEVREDLKKRTGGKKDKLRSVGTDKYFKVSPKAFGLVGRKTIAVVRSQGGQKEPSQTKFKQTVTIKEAEASDLPIASD